jgi:hypothetical protein
MCCETQVVQRSYYHSHWAFEALRETWTTNMVLNKLTGPRIAEFAQQCFTLQPGQIEETEKNALRHAADHSSHKAGNTPAMTLKQLRVDSYNTVDCAGRVLADDTCRAVNCIIVHAVLPFRSLLIIRNSFESFDDILSTLTINTKLLQLVSFNASCWEMTLHMFVTFNFNYDTII